MFQVKPEARTYYELQAATLKFTFPRPGFLEGIKMKSQPIAIMTKVRLGCAPWRHARVQCALSGVRQSKPG